MSRFAPERHVLAEALRSPAFAAVTTLGRRPVDIGDDEAPGGKLAQYIVDFDELEAPASYRALVAGHTAAICTLGVGQPSKSTRAEVWKVEIEYVTAFAAACRDVGIRHFSAFTGEEEYVLAPGTQLKVTDVKAERGGLCTVKLTEIDGPRLVA